MKTLSKFVVEESKLLIYTEYCEAVVDQCRKWGGKFDKARGCWVVNQSRLADVQAELGSTFGDLVEIEVRYETGERPGYNESGNAIHCGWYVLASRRSRDSKASVYAELVAGEIPSSGGSVKNPRVAGQGCAYRLWVPRDFAENNKFTVVSDPKAGQPADSQPDAAPEVPADPAVNVLEAFSDAQLVAELERRGLKVVQIAA